jgi:hypothetical protein
MWTNKIDVVVSSDSLFAFFFADLSPSVDGVDTLYTSTSAQGDGVHKYSKVFNGSSYDWVSNGFSALTAIDAMAATVNGSNVTVFATNGSAIYQWTDSSGYNIPISGTLGAAILTADSNESFRGLAFAPSATIGSGLPGDYNGNGQVEAADYVLWRKYKGTQTVLPNDPTGGLIGTAQYNTWRAHFGAGGSGSSLGGIAVPEPATVFLVCAGMLGSMILPRRQ